MHQRGKCPNRSSWRSAAPLESTADTGLFRRDGNCACTSGCCRGERPWSKHAPHRTVYEVRFRAALLVTAQPAARARGGSGGCGLARRCEYDHTLASPPRRQPCPLARGTGPRPGESSCSRSAGNTQHLNTSSSRCCPPCSWRQTRLRAYAWAGQLLADMHDAVRPSRRTPAPPRRPTESGQRLS